MLEFSVFSLQVLLFEGQRKQDHPPVFLLAVHQQLVEEEENPLLHVAGRDLEQDALHEHLRAGVRDVGALRRDTWGEAAG